MPLFLSQYKGEIQRTDFVFCLQNGKRDAGGHVIQKGNAFETDVG